MHSDLHYALFVAEQRRLNKLPRPDRQPRSRSQLRNRAGNTLIDLGLRLREHPPDPQRV